MLYHEDLEFETLGELEDLEMEDFEDLEDDEDMEILGELGEGEFEDFEDYEDFEDEYEDFEGALSKSPAKGKAAKKVQNKKVARQIAKVIGKAVAGNTGAAMANKVAAKASREDEYEDMYDYEGDSEEELEYEFEAAGGKRKDLDRMSYYAVRAAEAESEAEADQFLGALASIASKAIPAIAKVARPLVKRGIQAAGRFLRSRGRRAIRALPTVAARTVRDISNDVRSGRPMTMQRGLATLSRNAARTYLSSRRRAQAQRMAMLRARRYAARRRMRPYRMRRRMYPMYA